MTAPRIAVLMAATGLALAACGSGSDSAPPVTEPTPVAEPTDDGTAAADDFTAADNSSDPALEADPSSESDDTAEPEASNEPPPAESADPADDTADDAPVEEPPATEPAVEAPAAPVLGGRSLAADVQPAAQFDGNPLPDLMVDDLGSGLQANVANILPSDRPVLLWAWAPH